MHALPPAADPSLSLSVSSDSSAKDKANTVNIASSILPKQLQLLPRTRRPGSEHFAAALMDSSYFTKASSKLKHATVQD
jgi:hypothetical protein